MKRIILVSALMMLLIASCSPGGTPDSPATTFATPTNNPLFPNLGTESQANPASADSATAPTLAFIFQPINTSTAKPLLTPVPTATREPEAVVTGEPITQTQISSAIYSDTLNPNWVSIADNMTIDLENQAYTFQGKNSIKITPKDDFGSAYFVVSPNAPAAFSRERVLGIEFKLSGGPKPIGTADLAIAVLGSNEFSYYKPGDTSVSNSIDPVFPETRLYDLQFNQTIPANTWVNVIIWLDELIYEPIYSSFTGIYIKNDESYHNDFYIDDMQLILLSEDETASLENLPTPIGGEGTSQTRETINISVNTSKNVHSINSMIYGISGAPADVLADLMPGLNSWGGNPSTRYNWKLGNAWNAGRDYFYQNTDYGNPKGSVSDSFIEEASEAGIPTRMSLSTIGWVAKNSDPKTCSFPLPDGSCGDSNNESCINPGDLPDPTLANVPSDVDSIVDWVNHMLVDKEYEVKIFAMDNEPELWGVNHYDVHPECTTYQEILQKYLDYASAVNSAAPSAELAGPMTCCWHYYWNSPAGELDKLNNGNMGFLPWFLENVKKHDIKTSTKTIDVLDIHYYPEGLYNQKVDIETAAHRLRATRSLWDREYYDESWIAEQVYLIPRMKELIAQYYPGLKFGISEWNFGADEDINGALAIADVLGIFGKEDIYYANYWMYPPLGSPGAFAFKMYTNYDDEGGKFGNVSVDAISSNRDLIASYGSIDRTTNRLHLMIINKDPSSTLAVRVKLTNFINPSKAMLYRYSQADLSKIVATEVVWPDQNGVLIVPPYSISHYELIP